MMRIIPMAALAAVLLAGGAAQPPAPVVDHNLGATAAPAIAATPGGSVPTYTMKPGETLYSIAAQNHIDPRDLAAWNGISDPTKVQSGQVLRLTAPGAASASTGTASAGAQTAPIAGMSGLDTRPLSAEPARTDTRPVIAAAPTMSSVPVKSGPKAVRLPYSDENLAALQSGGTGSVQTTKADTAIAAAATRPPTAPDDPDRVDWSWPVSGKLLSGFSEATKGVEIGARNGEPVYASAGGRVVYSGSGLRGYGKLVIIKHNDKYLSAYGNNRKLLVKEGDAVTKGQKIAEVGAENGAPKLHFEIRQLGKPVDPMKFLPER